MSRLVQVQYFKPSGKWAYDGWTKLECGEIAIGKEFWTKVDKDGKAPGLSTKGEGLYVLLTPLGGVPRLLMPREQCTIVCGDIQNFGGTCNHGRKS